MIEYSKNEKKKKIMENWKERIEEHLVGVYLPKTTKNKQTS